LGNTTVSPFRLVLISFGGTASPAFPLDYTTAQRHSLQVCVVGLVVV